MESGDFLFSILKSAFADLQCAIAGAPRVRRLATVGRLAVGLPVVWKRTASLTNTEDTEITEPPNPSHFRFVVRQSDSVQYIREWGLGALCYSVSSVAKTGRSWGESNNKFVRGFRGFRGYQSDHRLTPHPPPVLSTDPTPPPNPVSPSTRHASDHPSSARSASARS